MKLLISFWNLCSSVMNLWYSFFFFFSLKGCPQLLFNSACLQQSCGSGVLADGRLADLIRRVATFGMVLMKLDLHQVRFKFSLPLFWVISCDLKLGVWQESGRHADTLDAITRYLDIGTYGEWDEEKKLDFLTRELKGKRPLVPVDIEVRRLEFLVYWAQLVVIISTLLAISDYYLDFF